MKILAVRLAEVGCFSNAIALEGLSSGLNILCGANEAGKSTIFAALRMAFEQLHTTKHRSVEALRPYAGGAPLVEVDFALGTDTWRLRKQYLTGRMAELRNLTTGQISRGADAEDNLANLLGQAGGRSSLNLLWASQKDALTPSPPPDDAATGLKRVISAEIATTVGGSEARHVRAAVLAELEQHMTSHKPARPRGDYDAAIKMRARLESDLTLAVGRRDAALARLDRLAQLKLNEAELCDPQQMTARAEAVKRAEAVAASARDALQKQRAAADAVSAAESRLDLARSKRDALHEDLQRLDSLSAEVTLDQDKGREIASALADVETLAAEAREARDTARNVIGAAERELKAAVEAERRQEAEVRLGELTQTLAAAEDATRIGLDLRAALDAIRITPDLLRAIRTEDDAIRRIEDRLAAAAPKVTIAYLPGGAGRITHDGAPLDAGAHLVERPLVLTIEGIGTIEIAPGASDGAAGIHDALAHHLAVRDRHLAEANVTGLAEADSQLTERQRLEADIGEARARLSALTPGGSITRLKAEIDTLTARLAVAGDDDVRPRSDIERDIDAGRRALLEAEPSDERAQRALAKEREAGARHAATSADRLKRLAELEQKMPPPAAKDAIVGALQTAVDTCERALHAAVRELTAWREQAPEPSHLQALEAEALRAAEAHRNEERQREETRRGIASLEGELRADRNDEVEARVAELQGTLDIATQRLTRMEDDVAALQLLDGELRAEEMRSRDQYLQPISDRLSPIVQQVFPGADVSIAENFAPASLRRASDREAIAALSEGTQEQLAVMVRLAFGRLMADGGSAVPVILDDALVYSDDERILRMFAALITAARHHQVIVLTCRSRTFDSLDGHRLKIAPWQPDTASQPRPMLAAG